MSRLYSHVDLPAITLPSSTCLQWSGDGQVFIATKNSVYIMTPNHTAAKVKHPQRTPHDGSLKWFRTMIEIDRQATQNWASLTEEWGTVVLGSFDNAIRTLALSPSNLTKDAGCLAAILTSSLELSLWAPEKDRLQGEWTKIQDLTPVLRHMAYGDSLPSTACTLQAQATSVTWSRQGYFGIDPAPVLDASLVAVGTRGGTLRFLRFDQGLFGCRSCAEPFTLTDVWITQSVFSEWTLVEVGKCQAFLACGDSDGAVEVLTVTQCLSSTPSSSGFGSHFGVSKPQIERQIGQVISPDSRLLTTLTWAVCKATMILVASKPGLVFLWAPRQLNGLGWCGQRVLQMQPQKFSAGSSPMQSASGVQYLPNQDVLIICLLDGSFHTIYRVSVDPSWTSAPPIPDLSSQKLSETARLTFCRTQRGKVRYTDVNTTRGFVPYDNNATFLWVNELCQPTDLNYRYNTERHATFIAARLWKYDEEAFLRDLEAILTTTKTGDTPMNLIRPCFLYFSDYPKIAFDVLKLLQAPIDFVAKEKLFSELPSSSDVAFCQSLRHEFRESLSRYLFGSILLLQLRMRLVVADALLRTLPKGSVREDCDQTACQVSLSLSQIVLHVLIRHLCPMSTVLTINDAPFALRIIHQSTRSNCPAGLASASKPLTGRIHSILSSSGLTQVEQENLMKESCPACGSLIRLEGTADAICGNGHSWSRCSITSFILSTGMIRRCVGCNRKAILPLSCRSSFPGMPNWLPQQARESWVVEELLEAVNRCLFCGNIFVHAL